MLIKTGFFLLDSFRVLLYSFLPGLAGSYQFVIPGGNQGYGFGWIRSVDSLSVNISKKEI